MRFRYKNVAVLSLLINGAILVYLIVPVITFLLQKGMSIETYFAWRDASIYLILAILHFVIAYGLYEGNKEALVASFALSIMGLVFFISVFPLQLFYALALLSLIALIVKGES